MNFDVLNKKHQKIYFLQNCLDTEFRILDVIKVHFYEIPKQSHYIRKIDNLLMLLWYCQLTS